MICPSKRRGISQLEVDCVRNPIYVYSAVALCKLELGSWTWRNQIAPQSSSGFVGITKEF